MTDIIQEPGASPSIAPRRRLLKKLQSLCAEEWGENSSRLFKGLSAIGPYLLLARFFTATGQILAARWLGPVEFGAAALILAAANILLIPMTLGFPASVIKFAPRENAFQGQAAVVSTGLWLQLIWVVGCAGALYWLRARLGVLLHIEPRLFSWTLIYTILLAFYTFASGALQGVLRFSERGKTEFYYGLGVVLFFLVAYKSITRDFETLIGAMDVALILGVLASIFYLWRYLRPILSRAALRDIASYTFPALISGCAGAMLQSVSQLMLAAQMSHREVGYFGAYEMGSIGITMVVYQLISVVLIPLASVPDRQGGAWKKFFTLAAPISVASFLFFGGAQYAMLRLMGKGYPIVPTWVALFSASSVGCLLCSCTLALLSAQDSVAAWLGTAGAVLTATCAFVASIWSIRRFGFPGSAIGLMIGYGAGFLWCSVWGWLRLPDMQARGIL